MALQWSIENVKDCEQVCFDHDADGSRSAMKHITHYLIMSSMALGLRGITDKNWRTFYKRLHVLESVALGEREYTSIEDVRSHIGLTVNVADETDAKWAARIAKNIVGNRLSDADYKLREWDKALARERGDIK